MSKKIEILKLLVEKARKNKIEAINNQKYEDASAFRDEERKFLKEIEELEKINDKEDGH